MNPMNPNCAPCPIIAALATRRPLSPDAQIAEDN